MKDKMFPIDENALYILEKYEKLCKAFLKYAQHAYGCNKRYPDLQHRNCDCGFEEVWYEAREKLEK